MGTKPLTSYQLLIHKEQYSCIQIGKLGRFDFPPGYYLYTGSARKNLAHRVLRHISHNKKLRWHIDYLLMSQGVQVIDIGLFSITECSLNQRSNGDILISGFGASDCQHGCGSHLRYLGSAIPCPDWPGNN